VDAFRQPGAKDSTVLLLVGRHTDRVESMVITMSAQGGRPTRLVERPGVFRFRDPLEEQADLCVQGEGDRRVVSLLNHCRAALSSTLPPLASWQPIQLDYVEAPVPPSDLPGRGVVVRANSSARFSLRLQSPTGVYPVRQLRRFEVEVVGPLAMDSALVRIGAMDVDEVVRWSGWATPVRRDVTRGYARFHVDIDQWNRESGLDGFSGTGSLLLHFRGAVGSATPRETPLFLYITPVGRGAIP